MSAPDAHRATIAEIGRQAHLLVGRRSLPAFYAGLRQVLLTAFDATVAELAPDLPARVNPIEVLTRDAPQLAVLTVRAAFSDALGLVPEPEHRHVHHCLMLLAGHLGGPVAVADDADLTIIQQFVLPVAATFRAKALEQLPLLLAEQPESQSAIGADRVRRLRLFQADHEARNGKRLSEASISRTAMVDGHNLREWKSGILPDGSVMSGRIEKVLSGKTPLVLKQKPGRPSDY